MTADTVDRLVAWFESLSPESVGETDAHYASDAYFKDPFNEVRGSARIRRIFEHMFEQVAEPRFKITGRIAAGDSAFLAWDFTFRLGPAGKLVTVRGSSHLRFDSAGKVEYHRDYWDVAGELYEKLPLIGALMRWARRRLKAPQ